VATLAAAVTVGAVRRAGRLACALLLTRQGAKCEVQGLGFLLLLDFLHKLQATEQCKQQL
jgi:hypothetical protein